MPPISARRRAERKRRRSRLDVQPRDGVGGASFTHYHADYNAGANTVYAGPGTQSYLLLPTIPPHIEA
jgi:hypothetical protein